MALPAASEPGLMLPAWRRLLESRWRQRLAAVTSLSLAYHEAEERSRGRLRPGDQADAGQLTRLMRGAVTARRALFDTEEALARLSAGRYGRFWALAARDAPSNLISPVQLRCRPTIQRARVGDQPTLVTRPAI